MLAKQLLKSLRLILIIPLFAACHERQAGENNADAKSVSSNEKQTRNETISVNAPNYNPVEGLRSECLARLAFDVSQEVAWPTVRSQSGSSKIHSPAFSTNVPVVGGVGLRYGDLDIFVIEAPDEKRRDEVLSYLPRVAERLRKSWIAERQTTIAELETAHKISSMERAYIESSKELISDWKKDIDDIKANFEKFDPMIGGGEGYWKKTVIARTNYSNYRAYVQRGNLIYIFETLREIVTASDKQAHKEEFLKILANFRERAPYEIPTDPGVCFPYGFIKDDGRTPTEFRHAFRFNDAPGVIYTIDTATLHDRNIKWPLVTAAARASVNSPSQPEDEEQATVKQRIGPHTVPIGGLSAVQGGVVLEMTAKGSRPYEVYSVFTGYPGRMESAVLPYILVDMRTVPRNGAPELTENPPPYKTSKERLDLMLKSMRWRPTTPPMAEFVNP